MDVTAAATETPNWTVRPPQEIREERETKYRGLHVIVDAHHWSLTGATFAGHAVSASRYWWSSIGRPSIDAIADAAIVAADELLAAGWHVHDWRKHDDGEHCYTCRAER